MANLATIQKISKVREIDSPKRDICELRFADSLWHAVGAKNTYNVGQRVVFFSPGSVILKSTEAYKHLCDFVRKNAKGMEVTADYIRVHASSVGIKHKTHGLVLPLSLFPDLEKLPVQRVPHVFHMLISTQRTPWRVSAIEQESELLIDPKSLTTPIKWIERENKEVRIPQGDSKPKRE